MVATIWEQFLSIMKEEAGSRVVETWFKAVTLSRWDAIEHIVYLHAPNNFVKDWIKSHYTQLIQIHLARLFHVDALKISFVEQQKEEISIVTIHNSPSAVVVPTVALQSTSSENSALPTQNIVGRVSVNTAYTFDTFVVGPSNSLAYAAAQAVAEAPGAIYNPLFLYGESGLGKTHLLHAIGNAIKIMNKKSVVVYQSTDRFIQEFINAIRFDKVDRFRQKYQTVDVLLLDDIQFLSNKEQTQEAFFHIFNILHESRKQIVFSSDMLPQHITGLAQRLRSRLAWGLVADIQMPPLEMRVAILKKKAAHSGVQLQDDVAQYIATGPIKSIRELEGGLIRAMAFASLTGQPLSLDIAQRVITRIAPRDQEPVDLERIMQVVRNYYSYSFAELASKQRSKELTVVRQVVMYLIKQFTDKSLRDIGLMLGGRDHSTVIYALERVAQLRKEDQQFDASLRSIEERIKSA